MKKAVIVVGAHLVGKSFTINENLKPLLGINPEAHVFKIGDQTGYILSQSLEEADREVEETIEQYCGYDLMVFAARPYSEPGSKLKLMTSLLNRKKFSVSEIAIHSKSEAPKKAREIFNILNGV
jgi:hypothetical protein